MKYLSTALRIPTQRLAYLRPDFLVLSSLNKLALNLFTLARYSASFTLGRVKSEYEMVVAEHGMGGGIINSGCRYATKYTSFDYFYLVLPLTLL